MLLIIGILVILMIWPKGNIEDQLKNNSVPALAFAIIEDGEIQELEVVGELEKGKAAPKNSIFNVASVTKPVFSLAALKLIDAEVIGLDEPLHPYWIDADVKSDDRYKLLTPRILLSHQSGFLNWRWHYPDGKLAFTFDPGTKYQYSGEGMEYLKNAIQSKTGTKLNILMDSLVFDPLEMNDTRMIWDDAVDETRFAKWHDKDGNQYEIFKRKEAVASDDMMTTLEDLSKFAINVMEKGGLSDGLYNQMITPQVMLNDRLGFGLGWEVVPKMNGEGYALVHGGSDMGVKARIVVMPNVKKAFVAFANGDNGQKIIDRVMVSKFKPGAEILKNIYLPFAWRIIYLPF